MVRSHMLNLIGAYENYLAKVRQASSNTVASYIRDIRQFSEWLHEVGTVEILEVQGQNISDYLHHLQAGGKSAATVSPFAGQHQKFLVLSGFYRFPGTQPCHFRDSC